MMFVGETMCLAAFHTTLLVRQRLQGKLIDRSDDVSSELLPKPPPIIYVVPATCDFTATALAMAGLSLTDASVYQMLMGSTLLFTALLSVALLKRRFLRFEIFGIVLVIAGLTVVGTASKDSTATSPNPALGNILVIASQAVQSLQYVIEEKMMSTYCISPLQLVGMEGVFGMGISVIALALFQGMKSKPDDVIVALQQLGNSHLCLLASALILFAIPVLNGAAVTITKHLSATTRMVLSTLRNIGVWAFLMIYGSYFNETFRWQQLAGFALLVTGTAIYKKLVMIPLAFFQVDQTPAIILEQEGENNGGGGLEIQLGTSQ
jgi:drug/metabolite transporter (DMT)-like permease